MSSLGWIIDFCAQALRNMIIGLGGKLRTGLPCSPSFGIAVGSECHGDPVGYYGIFADLRKRLDDIILAFDKSGQIGYHG